MAQPKGMSKETYDKLQAVKEDSDFKVNTDLALQSIKFAIETLTKSLQDAHAKIDFIKADMTSKSYDLVRNVSDNLGGQMQTLGDFRDAITDLKNQVASLTEDVNDKMQAKAFFSLQDSMQHRIAMFKQELESLRHQNSQNMYDTLQKAVEKINAAKEEIINMPSQLPEFEHMIDQKIQMCELNGQNALIRSSNNERQLHLIERKIENIYQMIKEIKLSRS